MNKITVVLIKLIVLNNASIVGVYYNTKWYKIAVTIRGDEY